MGAPIRETLTLMLGGTSLTSGRLTTPPIPWTYYLAEDMMASPECKGPVRIINTGQGSQTSNFGAAQAALMAPLRPTHVLMEDFGINDCIIGPVTIPQATANFNSMVRSYRGANPDVIIAHQTMNSVAASDIGRAALPTYYANGLANAALNGLESLDNYNGTLIVPGGWPKPLPPGLSVSAFGPDGYVPWSGTWDPGMKNPNVALSGGNLIATVAGASQSAVLGTFGNTVEKSYYDATINVAGTHSVGFGFAGMSLAAGAYVGFDNNALGYGNDGAVRFNGAVVANYAPYGVGDVVNVACNGATSTVWFGLNGVWFSGDPASGVGGFVGSPNTRYPAISTNNGGQLTGNFSALRDYGDGLHPIWENSFKRYSYPNILPWARRMMAAFWT